MKIFAPDYYENFKCLMGECKHSCCIGWEIDIDSETAEYYKGIGGEFGERLRKNIDFGGECSCFRLDENERCPFLNKEGLCDIILNIGEASLCQICDDHPRFRRFYDSRTEMGIGLCCEAAAKLILEKADKTVLEKIDENEEIYYFSEEEEDFFKNRDKIFAILQNREKSIAERIEDVFSLYGAEVPEFDLENWAEFHLGLERLDEKWTEVLENIKNRPENPETMDETAAEQLLCYLVFRHFSMEEELVSLGFCVFGFYMIEKAAESVGIFEAARLWSSEIEYSDENKDLILDKLFEEVF